MIRVLAFIAALICVTSATAQPLPAALDKQNAIVIDTTKGRIVFKLRNDIAPQHAERIKQLARDGYYNNVPFHRVMDGFMAQTGDGQNFNGTGGSKYPNLKAEFSSVQFKRGIVGMARAASPDSANSQFFIMFAEAPFLNGQYTVIGEVVSGMDVVDKLKKAPPGSQSGAVADPDKMVKVQVASDIKYAAVAAGCKSHIWIAAALLFGLLPSVGQAEPAQVNTIREAFARLQTCWKPPPASEANPIDITVIVSFTRAGAILGRPRITYESEQANDNDRLIYRVAVMEALQRCTPMPFTEAMGGAIAGRPFAIQFRNRKPPPQPVEKRAWLTPKIL
jgi:peptidylprolyl isomerase